MATITAGSSKTFTAQVDNSSFVVIAPGGSIGQVVDQNGNIQPIGPNGTRRTFGPLNELQSITVSMQIGNASVELNGWSGGIPITAETNSTGQTVLDDASRAALGNSGVAVGVGLEKLSTNELRYYPADTARTTLTTGPVDHSGNGKHATLNSGLSAANCNATSGYFSTVAGANGHVLTDFTFNFNTDLVVIAAVVKAAAPGSLSWIMGNSVGGNTSETGFSVGCSTGPARLYVQSGAASDAAATGGTLCDGTDHDIVICYDYRTRSLYQWVDGVLIGSQASFVKATAGLCSRNWVFGNSSASTTALAVLFKHVNLFKQTGGTMPVNMNTVASSYHATPGNITTLFDKTTKSVGVFTIGQSNETGQGVTAATNTSVGTPIQDPTKPNGQTGKRSYYPSMAAALGASGYKADVFNYAVGSTSIRESWVGYLGNWTNGQYVKLGSWRINAGSVWKCNLASHSSIVACSTAPTGTANTTGADGIPWIYVGPMGSQYALGVQKRGSALYDPSGLISALMTAISAYPGSRKVLHIAFGQTDSNGGVSTPLADYSTAHQEIAKHAISAGATNVLLGLTIYASGVSGWYASDLAPGVADAVASMSSYSQVALGVNWFSALGTLPTSPASGLGLQADGLHGNDAVYDAGGPLLADRILSVVS